MYVCVSECVSLATLSIDGHKMQLFLFGAMKSKTQRLLSRQRFSDQLSGNFSNLFSIFNCETEKWKRAPTNRMWDRRECE